MRFFVYIVAIENYAVLEVPRLPITNVTTEYERKMTTRPIATCLKTVFAFLVCSSLPPAVR